MTLNYEPYADLEWKQQMQRELNQLVANRLVQNAARVGRAYQMATLSAVSGRWGAVWKDVRRKRITADHAHSIVDSLEGARLITPEMAMFYRGYIEQYLKLAPNTLDKQPQDVV
jgi:hypothetical protein